MTVPNTMPQYTADLERIQARKLNKHQLGIRLAAAEGLSAYWYQLTAAFGDRTFDKNFNPAFDKPGSAGYQALRWMTDAYRKSLVSGANINMVDVATAQTEMAKSSVSRIFPIRHRSRASITPSSIRPSSAGCAI